MSRRARLVVLAVGLALSAGVLVWGLVSIPGFGHYSGRYGRILARDTVPDRHATNAVVVTTFDYRGVDTLIEEFILFVSVVGVTLLLRTQRDEERARRAARAAEREDPETSDALRWVALGLVGPVALLAMYIVTHGHLTPGGGFQGGIVLATSLVLVFVAGRFAIARRGRGHPLLEAVHGTGAAAFAMIGFGGLIGTGVFLRNFISSGGTGLLTGGMIPLANLSVGLEVTGALLLVVTELLDQRLLRPRR